MAISRTESPARTNGGRSGSHGSFVETSEAAHDSGGSFDGLVSATLTGPRADLGFRRSKWLSVGVQVSASTSEVKSATLTVTASARKKVPVTPVMVTRGRNTTIGVTVEPTRGTRISRRALRMASARRLPGFAMQDNVLDDDDGVVNHQTDRSGKTAERHQVEAFAHERARQ